MQLDFSIEFDQQETADNLKERLAVAEAFEKDTRKLEFKHWYEATCQYLAEHFTSNEIEKYFVAETDLTYSSVFWGDTSEEDMIVSYDLAKARKALRKIIKGVEGEVAEPQGVSEVSLEQSSKVFIVHGHDEKLKAQVARAIEQMKLAPIILSEQPNKGQTVIEKFEENSDVGFAVVLMTGDDEGASNADADEGVFKKRSRQNVILELGYFYGKLGRDRVFVLKETDVEEPSDILGVVYQSVDQAGLWKYMLGKELQASGYQVDLNTL